MGPPLAALAGSLALLALAAPGARAFRGDGARDLARGLAYLAARPDRGVLGEAEAAALPAMPPTARLARARTYLQAARDAAANLRERAEAGARLVEALEALAAAAGREGDSPVQIEALGAARVLEPAKASLGLALARALEKGGDPQGAAGELARLAAEPSLAPGSRAEVLRELARTREVLGEAGMPGAMEAALTVWRQLAADPDLHTRTTALARQAALAARLNHPDEALEAFGALAELRELTREEAREYLLARGSQRASSAGGISRARPDRHFEVQVEAPGQEASAEAVHRHFEAARRELGARLGVFPESRLLVRVIPAGRFRTQIAEGLEAVQRASGVVLALALDRGSDHYRPVVFHEYAHFLVRKKAKGRQPPRWVNEGIAMLCEGERIPLPWYKRVSLARKQGTLLDAAGLAAFGEGRRAELPLAYAQAALLLEHLVDRKGPAVLPALVEAFAEGLDADRALVRVAGHPVADLLEAWRDGWPEQLRRRLAQARADRVPEAEVDRQPWADEGERASAP